MTSKNIDFIGLIPNYQQGLIDPELAELFEQELEENDELRLEFEEYKKMRKMFALCEDKEPEPSDELFGKILQSIDIEEKKDEMEVRVSGLERRSGVTVIARSCMELGRWLKETTTIPWALAAVQAVALLVIFIVIPLKEERYATLSAPAELHQAADQPAYNVVFAPSATETEMRNILLQVHGNIVSGPTSEGRYIVAIEDEHVSDEAIRALKQQGTVLVWERLYH